MFTFELTEDISLIKAVMGHPACYRFLHDDYAPPREEWEPLMGNQLVQYIVVREDGCVIGMFQCSLHSAVEVEIHTAFLPEAWGRSVRRAAQECREWIWNSFPTVKRIIGKVPHSNRASLNYAEAIGMKAFGVDERSFLRNGKLVDQVYFGISRPEAA